jgi:hypothetical protein
MSGVKRYVAKSLREVTGTDEWSAPDSVVLVLASDYDTLLAANQQLEWEVARLKDGLVKIIEMNRQHAKDQFGDYNKAESWACVTVARAALRGNGGDV